MNDNRYIVIRHHPTLPDMVIGQPPITLEQATATSERRQRIANRLGERARYAVYELCPAHMLAEA